MQPDFAEFAPLFPKGGEVEVNPEDLRLAIQMLRRYNYVPADLREELARQVGMEQDGRQQRCAARYRSTVGRQP